MSFKTKLMAPEAFAARLGVAVDPFAPKYHTVKRSPSGKLYYLLPKRNEPRKFYKKYLTPSQTKRCIDGKLAVHKGGVCRAKIAKRKRAAAKAVITRQVNDQTLRSARQVRGTRMKQRRKAQQQQK